LKKIDKQINHSYYKKIDKQIKSLILYEHELQIMCAYNINCFFSHY